MYGKNEVAKSRTIDEGFLVHSIFHTLQGEGPFAGHPALFVRFAGCHLKCFWCDTSFEGGDRFFLDQLTRKIVTMLSERPTTKLIVFTGGEPMLQPLHALLQDLPDDVIFQVETAGATWPIGFDMKDMLVKHTSRLHFVVSPKTPTLHPRAVINANAWKYIIAPNEVGFDGLPVSSTQLEGRSALIFRPPTGHHAPIYVQARDDGDPVKNLANQKFAAEIAMKHGYRLSTQIHKLLDLP